MESCNKPTPRLLTKKKHKQRKMLLINKKTDWSHFKANLDETLTLIIRQRTPIEIDTSVEQLTNNIVKAATPITPTGGNLKNETFKSYLSELSATNNTDYSLWKATRHMKSPRAYVLSNGKLEDRVFQPNEVVSKLDIVQYQQLNEICDKIKHFTPVEIAKEINMNINPKKASGYDQINPKILKELSKKAMIHLTHIFNTILRMEYVPKQWKRAQVIIVLKLGKSPEELPNNWCALLESYLDSIQFRVINEEALTDWKNISADIPQGSVIGPILYLLYTIDIPTTNYSMTAMFADDTVIMITNEDQQIATDWLQRSIYNVSNWTNINRYY
ncbi:Reverse transcriptase domain [Cinara cedri]|uniref:Reverse transcriptase domain n=1 Tax=Cinara cedri TaxID=506608 RepID=A0A5E4ME53_9HEMI|nr:Reverse transcriptase domain [Cinara cedri]